MERPAQQYFKSVSIQFGVITKPTYVLISPGALSWNQGAELVLIKVAHAKDKIMPAFAELINTFPMVILIYISNYIQCLVTNALGLDNASSRDDLDRLSRRVTVEIHGCEILLKF
jgi:hypothetical protein